MRHWSLLALLVGLAATAAACGGDSSSGHSGSHSAAVERYAGSGTRNLRPASYPRGARVRWRCDACSTFYLIAVRRPAATSPQLIVSKARSGTGAIGPGRYELKVAADNAWSLEITPRR